MDAVTGMTGKVTGFATSTAGKPINLAKNSAWAMMGYPAEETPEMKAEREEEERLLKEKEETLGTRSDAMKFGGVMGYVFSVGFGPLICAGVLSTPIGLPGLIAGAGVGAVGGAFGAKLFYDYGDYSDESSGFLGGGLLGGLCVGVPAAILL
eukprot:TRINITY_DN18355_c0_g1_i1.p1 TRINITY_DN18355_c0_g1~~TRINITY_DN18355_c0_g1_i1.p1  ORF type:complete len:152 (-),score=25.54 TRINITY_DN18355_c0_g1_i1:46-501(-)